MQVDKKVYKLRPETFKYKKMMEEKNNKIFIRDRSADEIRSKKNRTFTETEEVPIKRGRKNFYGKLKKSDNDDILSNKRGLKRFDITFKSTVGKILENSNEVPIYSERFHFKKVPNNGNPSKLYVKYNNRITMLPHQYLPITNYKKEKYASTYNDIFSRDFKNVKTPKIHREKYLNNKDHLGPVLTYQNAPKYREIKTTGKPNYVPYDALCKQIEKNQKERFQYKYVD